MANELKLTNRRKHQQPCILCVYCQAIADGWPSFHENAKDEVIFEHYDSESDLEASAVRGCSLCTQFVRSTVVNSAIRHTEIKSGSVKVSRAGRWTLSPAASMEAKNTWELLYERAVAVKGDGGGWLSGRIVHAIPTSPPEIGTASLGKKELNTKDGIPIAKEWLDHCCLAHHGCKSLHAGYVPTRLVDVVEAPRLCLQDTVEKNAEYATLSHCWGENKFPTLTKGSVIEFSKKIPTSALSKTFENAIEIAQDLGIRYIWIDSLCIIQDDVADWERESALMTSVYGSAKLNIAASAAADGRDGCFFQRDSTWRCQLEISHGAIVECYTPQFHNDSLDVPLATKGWALQERLISPRTLFMTKSQLFWQCSSAEACEIFSEPLRGASSLCYGGRATLELSTWNRIIYWYSRCNITRSHDKLVALAGIARRIHDQTGVQYLAGLWMKNIVGQMCWNLPTPATYRVPGYRAPSWSWASVDGELNYNFYYPLDERSDLLIKVIDSQFIYRVPDNPFGEVHGASLHLRCDHLLKGNLTRSSHGADFICRFDEVGQTGASVLFDYTDKCSRNPGPAMFFLPLRHSSYFKCEGLLLHPTGSMPGEYERVGWFRTVSDKSSPTWVAKALQRDTKKSPNREFFSEVKTMKNGSVQKFIILV